ncbi:SGNH/GDSL hydrolase family protein [Streptomyces sp. NPDC052396]|uniref:SGNH/GDSL hydrolase family protein n=1 Tax=Streptomyces sp. NPDC052396 TaxID=3365689 RepID=UPI0037D05928
MTRPLPRGIRYALPAALAAVVILVCTAVFLGGARRPERARDAVGEAPATPAGGWVGTWAAAPAFAEPNTGHGLPGFSLRNVVHTSVGGSAARVQFSNLFGDRPLAIGDASLAVAAKPPGRNGTATAAPGSMRRLTFGGQRSVTVPAGRSVVSDPARLTVPPAADLLVSLYSPVPAGPVTLHPHARQISYLARGEHVQDTGGTAYTGRTSYWRYVTGVDVWTTQAQGTLVALGDSLTDGVTSTPGADHRWPDFLAARLRREAGAPRYGVLNEGISGNRVLLGNRGRTPQNNPGALDRFDRDVLERTAVRVVVVDLGVNDILRRPQQLDPRRIVAGLRQLTARAHKRGLRVAGATLMPFGGHWGVTADRQEPVRLAVNRLIRAGGVFDTVVDFDQALRDPGDPHRLLPAYDSGDHLHPNDAGYRVMADAVDLAALRT